VNVNDLVTVSSPVLAPRAISRWLPVGPGYVTAGNRYSSNICIHLYMNNICVCLQSSHLCF